MYEFKYTRIEDIAVAEELLSGEDECVLLAGGMTLLPTMKQRLAQPSQLLDLAGLPDLAGVTVTENSVSIRAMTTHAVVASSERINERIPALSALAGDIGDPQVRNRGTIGGSVANADPAADYPAAVVALNGTVVTNHRSIAADEFFLDMFETALEGNEIVTSVSFKIPSRAAYMKFPNPASRYAVVGVFMAEYSGKYRIAVTGARGSVFRLDSVEAALENEASLESLNNAFKEYPVSGDEINEDIHASGEYRLHLIRVLTERAFNQLTVG